MSPCGFFPNGRDSERCRCAKRWWKVWCRRVSVERHWATRRKDCTERWRAPLSIYPKSIIRSPLWKIPPKRRCASIRSPRDCPTPLIKPYVVMITSITTAARTMIRHPTGSRIPSRTRKKFLSKPPREVDFPLQTKDLFLDRQQKKWVPKTHPAEDSIDEAAGPLQR